jgi:hypothetical protein
VDMGQSACHRVLGRRVQSLYLVDDARGQAREK